MLPSDSLDNADDMMLPSIEFSYNIIIFYLLHKASCFFLLWLVMTSFHFVVVLLELKNWMLRFCAIQCYLLIVLIIRMI